MLALGFEIPIIPSLLAGVVFALLTAVPWRDMTSTALRTLYQAFDMASYGQVLGVSDPTSTQTVWSAQYAGIRPERSMLSTLPYTWVIAIGGLILTVFLYLL